MEIKDQKNFFKAWLEKLQQESWQLELIISGFALFGVYNSRSALADFGMYITQVSDSFFERQLHTLFEVGWKIFFLNLLIHVILRSLWIGCIGLRYVSSEIEYDQLNYSARFTRFLKRKVGDYDDFIEKLEKICSVLFSYTFLLFLLFLSAISFLIFLTLPMIVLVWMGVSVEKAAVVFAFWSMLFSAIGLLVFIDFITLGVLKRIKEDPFARLYLPIYRFYGIITFSFLYRPLLYNFIDNKYTRRLFFFSIPYIFFIAAGQNMFSLETTHHPTSLLKEHCWKMACW